MTHTSTVAEEAAPDTAPSAKPAEAAQAQTDETSEEITFAEVMQGMTDHQLVQVGLIAMALLHQRAENVTQDE